MRAWFLDEARQAAYDTAYHLVWSPKYRKRILHGAIGARVEEMFKEIAETYDITIDEMEVSPEHVHVFCSFPPRYSIAQIVTRFKSLSARAVFREFPQVNSTATKNMSHVSPSQVGHSQFLRKTATLGRRVLGRRLLRQNCGR